MRIEIKLTDTFSEHVICDNMMCMNVHVAVTAHTLAEFVEFP